MTAAPCDCCSWKFWRVWFLNEAQLRFVALLAHGGLIYLFTHFELSVCVQIAEMDFALLAQPILSAFGSKRHGTVKTVGTVTVAGAKSFPNS